MSRHAACTMGDLVLRGPILSADAVCGRMDKLGCMHMTAVGDPHKLAVRNRSTEGCRVAAVETIQILAAVAAMAEKKVVNNHHSCSGSGSFLSVIYNTRTAVGRPYLAVVQLLDPPHGPLEEHGHAVVVPGTSVTTRRALAGRKSMRRRRHRTKSGAIIIISPAFVCDVCWVGGIPRRGEGLVYLE